MFEHFDSIIGLGGNCEVAFHTRRINVDRANVFDWWISPFQSTVDLLDNGFLGLFEPENMEIVGNRLAVRCKRYNIIHHHDFNRDGRDRVLVDEIGDQLERNRTKYGVLAERFYERCNNKRVLFVRSWRETLHTPKGYPEHCPAEAPRYAFEDLIRALERQVPSADFRIAFLNYGTQTCDDPRALTFNIRNHGDAVNWRGSGMGWNEMFQNLHAATQPSPVVSLRAAPPTTLRSLLPTKLIARFRRSGRDNPL